MVEVVPVRTRLDLPGELYCKTISWRTCPDSNGPQKVLLFSSDGVLELEALSSCEQSCCGSQLELRLADGSLPDGWAPWTEATCSASDGGEDVYFATERAVWRLDSRNLVHLVAGAYKQSGREDGAGSSARFSSVTALALGSDGFLYVKDSDCLRVVRTGGLLSAVSTPQLEPSGSLAALACDPSKGLVYLAVEMQWHDAHKTFKLPERMARSNAAQLEPWVGFTCPSEGWTCITDLAVTSEGNILALDSVTYRHGAQAGEDSDRLITLTAGGHQTAVEHNLHSCDRFTILPQGGLAFFSSGACDMWLWPRTIKPQGVDRSRTPQPLFSQGRVAADLSAFRANPSLPPDVSILAGGRAFPAHRLVLAARCEYFARLFAGGFADSGRDEVPLPDADPDAFELLLSYMYGGELRPTPALLRPLAELADRLLLLHASKNLQRQLLQATSPNCVVEDLLWAEGRGLKEVVAGLKSRYLNWEHLILEEAPESVEQLMTCNPKLHLELHTAMAKRARLM